MLIDLEVEQTSCIVSITCTISIFCDEYRNLQEHTHAITFPIIRKINHAENWPNRTRHCTERNYDGLIRGHIHSRASMSAKNHSRNHTYFERKHMQKTESYNITRDQRAFRETIDNPRSCTRTSIFVKNTD